MAIECAKKTSQLGSKISETIDRLRPKIIERLRNRARIELQTNLTFQKARLANLEHSEKELVGEVDRLARRKVELNKHGFKLEILEEDVSHLASMTRRLKNEHEALKVELMAPSRVVTLEEATVTHVKEPWRRFVPFLAGLGGFLFFFCCLAVRVRVSLR
jgi:hypothetical protein